MEGRAVGEVDEAGVAHRLGDLGALRLAPVQDGEAPDLGPELGEVGARDLDDPVGVLVGRRRRQDEDLGPTTRLEQPGIEVAGAVAPLPAADERERARDFRFWGAHRPHLTEPPAWRLLLTRR